MTVQGGVELQRRLKAIADTQGLMRQVGLETVREAKREYRNEHTKTGNTQRSVRLARASKNRAFVEAGGAAGFLERGTRPHVIRPKRARALRFAATSGGRRLSGSPRRGASVVFARSVRHPGTKPTPVLVPAAEKVLERRGVPRQFIVRSWDGAA